MNHKAFKTRLIVISYMFSVKDFGPLHLMLQACAEELFILQHFTLNNF